MTARDFVGGIKALAPNFNPAIHLGTAVNLTEVPAQPATDDAPAQPASVRILNWDAAALGAGEPPISVLIAAAEAAAAAPPPPPTQAAIAAQAYLLVTPDDIQGIDVAKGFGMAMALDVGVIWVFFSEPQPDDLYITFADARCDGERQDADVTMQTTDFVEITVTNRATGEPAVPSRLAISVQRLV